MFFHASKTFFYARGCCQGDACTVFITSYESVFLTQGQGTHAQPVGQSVHHALKGKADLRHPKSSECAAHGIVGVHAPSFGIHIGYPVGTGCVFQAKPHDLSPQMGIGPAVIIEAACKGLQGAVFCGAQTVMHPGCMAFVSRQKAFFPVPPHFHRPSLGVHGSQSQQSLNRGPVLAPESATQERTADMDVEHIQPQGVGNFKTVSEGSLGGNRHVQDPLIIHTGHAVFRFQKGVFLHGGFKGFFENHIAVGKGGIGISVNNLGFQENIARWMFLMHQGGTRIQSVINSPHCGQYFKIQNNTVQGLCQRFPVFGQDKYHRVTGVTDFGSTQDGHVLVHNAQPVGARNIFAGEHGKHPVHGLSLLCVDSFDMRMGHTCAFYTGPEHVFRVEVCCKTLFAQRLVHGIKSGRTASDFLNG